MRLGKQCWLDQIRAEPHISKSKICKSLIYLRKTCYIQMGPSNVSATGLSKIGKALNYVTLCFWL